MTMFAGDASLFVNGFMNQGLPSTMGCFSRRIGIVLLLLTFGGVLQLAPAQVGGDGPTWQSGEATVAAVQNGSGAGFPVDSDDEECQDEPGACIFGTLLGYLVAPIFETLFTDLQGASQPFQAPFGLRLEHRVRSVGGASRTHPYVGLGVRFVRRAPAYDYRGNVSPYFEAAAGYQGSLQPVLGRGSFVRRNAVLAGEAQWLYGSAGERFRVQVAPGLAIKRPSNRRIRVHLTLGVTVAGAETGDVYPGLSLGYRW